MGIIVSNFYHHFFGAKEIRICMFGLDNAGKTTILYGLKLGEIVTTIPTIGFNVETVRHKNINFTVWDVGAGGCKLQPLWHHYTQGARAIIFVIDATDRERIEEAEGAMKGLLYGNEMENSILLVIANKQDLPDAMTADEVTHGLRLNELSNRRWHIQLTSAVKGNGIHEAFDWLANELAG